jgi:hypothetical protein
MRRLILAIFLLSAPSAFAVVPQFWKTSSPEDFLAGHIEGFSITSRGELKLGPLVRKSVGFTDPFVLSQTSAPNGDRFFGTGNDGKVYRLRGTDLKAIYTAPEPEVYAVEFHGGQLYAATSPNGKIYRLDPESGKATPFFEPKAAYIWAMAFLANGDMAVATGLDGKVFRVTPSGSGKSIFDAPESHVRSLAVAPDGRILAGGSGKGRIYEIRSDGTARSLFDSPLTEISTIATDSTGTGWAAGVTNVLPTTAPAKSQPAKSGQQPATGSTAAAKEEPKKDGEGSSGGVEVNFSFDDSSGAAGQSGSGSSELYRIGTDGFVETVRKFEREIVYAISPAPDGSVLIATGPQGRIYRFRDHELALVATVPEKQVVSMTVLPNETLVTTTNSGGLYRLVGIGTGHSEYRSAVKDADRFSRFGHFKIEGRDLDPGALAISFRTGNTKTPDATWSAWTTPITALEGTIGAPAARYVQWKIDSAKPNPQMAVDSVTLGYVNRNVAPVIDSVTVADPGTVFITSSYPASPQVVEATNPDEYGIFTSLENPREKTDPGKKVFRKGYRTISWRAHDDNGDSLRYAVSFRRKGDDPWLRLRDNIEETSVNFDTSQLPDGTYEIRVSATDKTDNPEGALADSKTGVEFVVDNTPPVITTTTSGKDITIRVTDRLSNVGKVEYSIDAQKWIRLTPNDGIADSSDETYTLDRSAVKGHFAIIRAVDSFFNVATETVTVGK